MRPPTSIARSSSSASSVPTAADPIVGERPVAKSDRARPVSGWLATGCAAVVALCVLRAVIGGYVPLEDNAVTETRARDVFGPGIPLIGIVSSVSQVGAGVVNHPGPLLFDLLAIPVRLFPQGSGVAVGVGLIHIATIVALAWCARRLLGDAGACVVMAVGAGLVWSLGSDAWFEVWQPVVPVLPFVLALVAAWGLAAGHDVCAVPAVLAASFAVQTHGSYLLLGPTVLAAALACRWLVRRGVPAARAPWLWAAAVGTVVWVQPLIDQVGGQGNLAVLRRQAIAGADGRSLGLVDAVRAAAMVLVSPPFWLRPGVDSSLPNSGGLRGSGRDSVFDPDWMPFPIAAVGLLGLIAVVVLAGVVSRRRGDVVVVAGAVIAVAVVVAAVVSLAGLPVDRFGFTPHKCRWLWSIGAYLTAFGFVAVLRLGIAAHARQVSIAAALSGVGALVATLPTSNQLVSAQQYMVGSQDAARQLRSAVGALEGQGVVYLDLTGRPFPDPFNDTVAAEMAARGISFRVAGDYVVAQYGPRRELVDPVAVDVTVRTFVGGPAADLPPGWHAVADVHDGTQRVVLATYPGMVRAFVEPSG